MNGSDRGVGISFERDSVIVRTSVISIAVNLVLAGVKAFVGLAAQSIAVVLDAVNNLSDALSGIITIVGTKLSGRLPDRKHPLGYGRIEYLSATLVALIVFYAGITALYESVRRIISPQPSEYTPAALAMIALAVAVKFFLGRYVRKKGESVGSDSLRASGTDALSDALLSASVLVCATVRMITGINTEAYIGAVISVFIIRAGIEIIRETISEILGRRTDPELSREVKELVCQEDGVYGAYDLFLNNYGPRRYYGSVNIEIDDTLSAKDIDRMSRRIWGRVYRQTGVTLSCIGVYSRDPKDSESFRLREEIEQYVLSLDGIQQVYGFYISPEEKEIHFYVVMDFSMDYRFELTKIAADLEKRYPEYSFRLAPHLDISD